MKIVVSDLWTSKADIILVTTNATVNRHGALVMGRGAAEEAAIRYPDAPEYFGGIITRELPLDIWSRRYGVLLHPKHKLGIFQVKYFYAAKAEPNLIKFSSDMLREMLANGGKLSGKTVAINFPGIGWGGLELHHVMPHIEKLPDSVTIHVYGGSLDKLKEETGNNDA